MLTRVIDICASLVPIATSYQCFVVAFPILKGLFFKTTISLNLFQKLSLSASVLFNSALSLFDFVIFKKSFGFSITTNFGAGIESPILYT